MCEDPMLPESVAGALRDYGRLLDRHGITWGEPENHYVKLFGVRGVLPPQLLDRFWGLAFTRLADRHPGASVMELGARLGEPDYDELLRDTLEGRLPGSLAALRITDEGVRLEGAPAPRWARRPRCRCWSTPGATVPSGWRRQDGGGSSGRRGRGWSRCVPTAS
ncbi:hypothetical protein [Nonomuraea recticatena]|uniref:hypothetical protein n=1 Tax=Nonomuraea recticatena TaxID=46178 RepID=UPI0036223D08